MGEPKRDTSKTKIWRVPYLNDVELLRAEHLAQSFPKHTHECYAVGVIERGALGFFYRGENVVAAPGDISLCIPGEAHTGRPAGDEGWAYRMFYLDVHVLQKVASEVGEGPRDMPFFESGVITDDVLAGQFRALHGQLESEQLEGGALRLEGETRLLNVLASLITRHADAPPPGRRGGREPQAVTQVKRYLEGHYAENVSLERLTHLTGLSRHYLVRVFGEATGVPPHAYLRQVRVGRAKELLAVGHAVAEVAVMTGFTDQSHLTRWFKRLWGVTPGQYRSHSRSH